ncbi:hypothetical protein [Methylobacterium sp. sgz302541]|uniref:hypothetical protein n=1 Tax=unclassified Methylobacterium TaxID=2615210 RepID=UPI003D341DF3
MTAYEPLESAEVAAPLIHDGDHLVVRREEGGSDWTLVTFNESSMVASGGRYWAQSFARRNGLRALGFVTRAPNWFPVAGMTTAIGQLPTEAGDRRPRILYGHSMGAYAAIKFSAALRAETVLAFSPQFSIAPEDTGEFSLYTPYYSAQNSGMKIGPADVSGRVYLFYDPCLDHDRFHAGRIADIHDVVLIPVRHTGHDTIRCFASSSVALRLIAACRSDDRTSLLRLVAARRRLFPNRYRNVALAVARRRPHLAVRIISLKAESLRVEDIAGIYAAAGEAYFKRGRIALAEHCIMAATELNSRNVMHLLLRSAFLLHTKRQEEALIWARAALERAPDNAFARSRVREIEQVLADAPRN